MKTWIALLAFLWAGASALAQTTQPGRGRGSAIVDPAAEAKLVAQGKRNATVHDPSTIVKYKEEYWLFYTGRLVPSWHSKDLTTWERGPAAFAAPPGWVASAVPANRNGDFWAPDIIQVNGRFYLYYSVSTFGKNTSAIGLATNATLDPSDPNYKWIDAGIVIQSNDKSDYNCIDPAALLDEQGRLFLAFGSFWSGIRMIELDPKTGLRKDPESTVFKLAYNESIEAAYIYYHQGYYYLFVNWEKCCQGSRSTYNIRVGRSKEPTGPYLDKSGKDLAEKGGTLLLETDGDFVGPGHAGIIQVGDKYYMSMHFYDRARNGVSELGIKPVKWDADGWPRIGE